VNKLSFEGFTNDNLKQFYFAPFLKKNFGGEPPKDFPKASK